MYTVIDDMDYCIEDEYFFNDDYFESDVPDMKNGRYLCDSGLQSAIEGLCCEIQTLDAPINTNIISLVQGNINDFELCTNKLMGVVTNELDYAETRTANLVRAMCNKDGCDLSIETREFAMTAVKITANEIKDLKTMIAQLNSVLSGVGYIMEYIDDLLKTGRRYSNSGDEKLLDEYNNIREKAIRLICECDSRYIYFLQVHMHFKGISTERCKAMVMFHYAKDRELKSRNQNAAQNCEG